MNLDATRLRDALTTTPIVETPVPPGGRRPLTDIEAMLVMEVISEVITEAGDVR